MQNHIHIPVYQNTMRITLISPGICFVNYLMTLKSERQKYREDTVQHFQPVGLHNSIEATEAEDSTGITDGLHQYLTRHGHQCRQPRLGP